MLPVLADYLSVTLSNPRRIFRAELGECGFDGARPEPLFLERLLESVRPERLEGCGDDLHRRVHRLGDALGDRLPDPLDVETSVGGIDDPEARPRLL